VTIATRPFSLSTPRPVGGVIRQQAHARGETVHRIDGLRRDGWIVERRVAPDELGDHPRLLGREELAAHRSGAVRIFLQHLLRIFYRVDRGASRCRVFLEYFF
jgi:hypothetical protein